MVIDGAMGTVIQQYKLQVCCPVACILCANEEMPCPWVTGGERDLHVAGGTRKLEIEGKLEIEQAGN